LGSTPRAIRLGLVVHALDFPQQPLSAGADREDLAAAVALIALAHNQRLVLEPVDEGDDVDGGPAMAIFRRRRPRAWGARRALTDATLPIFHRHGRIAVRVRVHAPLPYGSTPTCSCRNLYMRWARITQIRALEDHRHPTVPVSRRTDLCATKS
jgi:hypothetical protein